LPDDAPGASKVPDPGTVAAMEGFYRPRLKPALEISSASRSPSSRTTSTVSQIPIHLIRCISMRINSADIVVIIWGNCSMEGLAEVVGSSCSVHLEGFSGTEDLNKGKRRAGLVARVPRDN
jgi:hypothetical protein